MANYCTTCGSPMGWNDPMCSYCGTPAAIVFDMGTMKEEIAKDMKQAYKAQMKEQFKQQLKQNAGIHIQPKVRFLGKDYAIGGGIHYNPFNRNGG